ncbi:MAG: hypothetical protein WA510_00005, partial [Acidobacteriaceae bacterium]
MKCLCWAAAALLVLPGNAQQTDVPQENPAQEHPGKVIFSRSIDSATKPAKSAESAGAPATDAERQAIAFLAYDLDIHLQPREHAMAVRARLQVRNDSDHPLHRLPLQISSAFQWTSVRVADGTAVFSQMKVDSDMDHTGALEEAVISLPRPLAPQQTLAVDVTYEGKAPLSATRLEQIGTPADIAEASDWDRVADDFVGLRGLGNVAWYPLASVPVRLGDGAKFFTEAAAGRLRQRQATVSMKVTAEFFGEAPNLAVLDGHTFTLTPTSLPAAALVPGIVTCTLPPTRLGFASPSLFMLNRTAREGNGVKVFARTENVESAQAYLAAATIVAPFLQQWLGTEPRGPLQIVDLPEQEDTPFEDGGVLFTPVRSTEPDKLAAVLVHSLTHIYFQSPYAWLEEGVPSFISSLWVEQKLGRDTAIQQLDNDRAALSLAEPADSLSEDVERQALLSARDPVYYRTKATYVFWMLRDLAGDDALGRALRAYQPGSDSAGTGFEQVLQRASNKDLKWFFENWVYHDRGLPDLSIAGVYPNKASLPGAYVVAVDVTNSGTAEAQVPVSVSSATATVTETLRIPARSQVSHRFVVQGRPTEVAVNDGTVPEAEASVHRQTVSFSA